MGASGNASLNWGLTPGTNVVTVAVTGQAGIIAGSQAEAWLMGSSTTRSGTGDSLTFATPIITLVDAAGTFAAGDVGKTIYITGCANAGNNGYFVIASFISATSVTYSNLSGVTETSAFTWALMDGHNAYEHSVVPMRLTCGDIVPGVGFTITAVTDWRLDGVFTAQWVWL